MKRASIGPRFSGGWGLLHKVVLLGLLFHCRLLNLQQPTANSLAALHLQWTKAVGCNVALKASLLVVD